jgi:hypothetical protein
MVMLLVVEELTIGSISASIGVVRGGSAEIFLSTAAILLE